MRSLLIATAVLAAMASSVVLSAGSSGAVTGSPSSFESADGNMTLDNGPGTDWNCFVQDTQDGFAGNAQTPSGCKVSTGATQVTADAKGEIEWVNGQKFDTACPSLQLGNNPPKDEFTNVASFSDSESSTPYDVFFYGATIRSTANGNASGDVEFNQNKGKAGCRTAGDRLLAYDYLNGGTTLNFHVLTWIDSGNQTLGGNSGTCFVKTDSMPCWGANANLVSPSLFDGKSNQAAIAAADNGISNVALAINQFAEFGIDLTAALDLGQQCFSFPQQVWESRSSGSSFTSNPEDIEIESRPIQNCGEIKIIKQTDPRGQNALFGFTSGSSPLPANSAGGVICTNNTTAGVQSDGSFCLDDSGNAGKTLGSTAGTDNSTGNTIDEAGVPQGTYTVTEGPEPGSFSFESLSCTADGTSGSSASTSTQTATITLKPSGLVTCVYENQLHLGAIVITKTGKDVNCASSSTTINNGVCTGSKTADLTGATFDVSSDQADTATNRIATGVTTGSNGTVCVGLLPWSGTGTTYYVTETNPPPGYALPSPTYQGVAVTQNATCATATGAATASFSDQPLTDLTVKVVAEVPGATNSTISCVAATTTTAVGNSPQGPGDPETLTADGLAPATYTCTVVIDP